MVKNAKPKVKEKKKDEYNFDYMKTNKCKNKSGNINYWRKVVVVVIK